MEKSNNTTPHLIEIPRVNDPRGNLSFIQHPGALPFEPNRVEWKYDIYADQIDTAQHVATHNKMVVVLSGALDITLDGNTHRLDRPYRGLFIPAGQMFGYINYATNTVVMEIDGGCKNTPVEHVSDPHPTSSLNDVSVIELTRQSIGSNSITRWINDSFFSVRRIFYLYDVPSDSERGGHSHYQARELIVAVAGAFDVTLDDGSQRRTYHLDRPYKALYVPRGLWRELNNFTSGAVCMVMTTELFEEADYVREYDRFLELTSPKRL